MIDTRKTNPQLDAAISYLVGQSDKPRLATWATDLNDARNVGNVRTLKTWLQNHDTVETLQVRFTDDEDVTKITGGWLPGPRGVTTGATFATFDGSRRDYAGIICITSTDEVWAGWNAEARTLVAYSTI